MAKSILTPNPQLVAPSGQAVSTQQEPTEQQIAVAEKAYAIRQADSIAKAVDDIPEPAQTVVRQIAFRIERALEFRADAHVSAEEFSQLANFALALVGSARAAA